MVVYIITSILGLFIYILITYIYKIWKECKHGAVPGPFPLPVIGNLHLIGEDVHKDLLSLSKIYGEVFAIYLGSKKFVVVSGARSIKEVLIEKGTHFAGRPYMDIKAEIATSGYKDIVAADYGPRLKFMRKLFARGLNLHGFNKKSLEDSIIKYADATIAHLQEPKLSDPTRYVNLGIVNVVMNMVFDTELDFEDPIFENILEAHRQIFNAIKPGPEDVFPWLTYFPNKNIRNVREGNRIRSEILERFIQGHRQSYKQGTIRDATDAMIAAEVEEIENGGDKLDDVTFKMLITDIFSGGIETSSTSILWIMLYLAKYPKIQTKMREELVKVNLENLDADKSSTLPYTHAVIHEGQRLGSIAAIAPHKTTRDTSIQGFKVAKDTPVFVNFYGGMRDKNVFENPENFIPERWIDAEGKYEPHTSAVLAFGAGPRVCPGKRLAVMMLFIFVTRIVKNFFLEEIEGHENSFEGDFGLTLAPKNLRLKIRKID